MNSISSRQQQHLAQKLAAYNANLSLVNQKQIDQLGEMLQMFGKFCHSPEMQPLFDDEDCEKIMAAEDVICAAFRAAKAKQDLLAYPGAKLVTERV